MLWKNLNSLAGHKGKISHMTHEVRLMSNDPVKDLRQLKQDYFKLLEDRKEEREVLLRVINAISSAASASQKIKRNLKN